MLHGCGVAEILTNLQQRFRRLAAFQLVGFCQQDVHRQSHGICKTQHLAIVVG